MAQVMVDVTAEDIAQGHAASCRACPIALALHRLVGPDVEVIVFGAWVRLQQGRQTRKVRLPRAVGAWIAHFDLGLPVHPVSFPLEIPELFRAAAA
jgi:hypothetical protein